MISALSLPLFPIVSLPNLLLQFPSILYFYFGESWRVVYSSALYSKPLSNWRLIPQLPLGFLCAH